MKVIADICIIPMEAELSISKYIARAEELFKEAGLKTFLHAYGTNIEGPYDEVVQTLKRCHEEIHKMGVPRINTSIRLETRTDRNQNMEDKIRSVEKLLKSRR